jgi:hypothetical protein
MKEKQLYEFWKKYINIPIYRAIPKNHLKSVIKNGITPGKDPYKEMHNKIRSLSKIVDRLEKIGFVMELNWGIKVSGSYAIKTTILDFEESYVDFTPSRKSAESYLLLEGGALVSNLREITTRLIHKKELLNKNELELVQYVSKWAEKNRCNNILLVVSGSSKSFETGLILPRIPNRKRTKRKKRKHLASCFGSFEHFKKVFNTNPKKYMKILEEPSFYLRLRKKMSPNEIEVIK